jgi:hypothetical protein
MLGPIAFKAKDDGISISEHPDGKVRLLEVLVNLSLFSTRKDPTITLKHGEIWNHSLKLERSGLLVCDHSQV